MLESTILLSSVTWAIRAQKLLDARGILSDIRKITAHRGLNGCGYALKVRGGGIAARDILRSAGIPVVDIVYEEDSL